VGELRQKLLHQLLSGQVWQRKAKNDHVRTVLAKRLNRFSSVGSLGNQRHSRLATENGGKTFTNQRMLVHCKQPNRRNRRPRVPWKARSRAGSSKNRTCGCGHSSSSPSLLEPAIPLPASLLTTMPDDR